MNFTTRKNSEDVGCFGISSYAFVELESFGVLVQPPARAFSVSSIIFVYFSLNYLFLVEQLMISAQIGAVCTNFDSNVNSHIPSL